MEIFNTISPLVIYLSIVFNFKNVLGCIIIFNMSYIIFYIVI